MTIAEEQIKRLAQEAHAFAREAHEKASVTQNKFEELVASHTPVIDATKVTLDHIEEVVNTFNRRITDVENVLKSALPDIMNNMRALEQQIALIGAQLTALQNPEKAVEPVAETVSETVTETAAQG